MRSFDNIDHDILIKLLRRRIDDDKFVNLIGKMLKAGVMEGHVYHRTYSRNSAGWDRVSDLGEHLSSRTRRLRRLERIAAFEKGRSRAVEP